MASAHRNDLIRLDGNFESRMILGAEGISVEENLLGPAKTMMRPSGDSARRMKGSPSRMKANTQSQSAATMACIDDGIDPTAPNWKHTWKTQEVLTHTHNAWTHTINEDFPKAVRELEQAVTKTQGRIRALRVRRDLMKDRGRCNVALRRFARDQQPLKCSCTSCKNSGDTLYRSLLCRERAVRPTSNEPLAFSEQHQSAFAYRWQSDTNPDFTSGLLRRFKDCSGSDELALFFAVLLKEFVTNYSPTFLKGVDVIVPVPADPVRLKERGFDPVGKIFRIFSELVCIPYASGTLVKEHSSSCRSMNARERERASRGMFSSVAGQHFSGLNVLLVDDVITSGHTIKNCCALLRKSDDSVNIRVLSLFQSESSRKAAEVA